MIRQRRPLAPCFAFALLFSGCVQYQAQPLDAPGSLQTLNQQRLDPSSPHWPETLGPDSGLDLDDGLSLPEAQAVAVSLHPALQAERAKLAVSEALLVEAGLLPDPEVGWGAMDWIIGGTRDDAIVGLEALFRLQAPGSRQARIDLATAEWQQSRWALLEMEWHHAGKTRQCFVRLLGLRGVWQSLQSQQAMVEATRQGLKDAFELGEATALQSHLADLDLRRLEVLQLSWEARLNQEIQQLNQLLGLPPGSEVLLQPMETATKEQAWLEESAEALTEEALNRRPDLQALAAAYDAAEAKLRLAIARQWPDLSIGTGLYLNLPLFSKANRAAIETALAQRQQLARQWQAAIHQVRAEIHQAHQQWQLARRRTESMTDGFREQQQACLQSLQQSQALGESTPLEQLTVQSRLLELQESLWQLQLQLETARTQLIHLAALDLPSSSS
ncbi:MAG: TolC family protein [Planctomycetota bacterium]|nr:MAG: TolC family protein [Planctomycetota bacterium]